MTPHFREITAHDEENKLHKIDKDGLSNWIIAIDKNDKPILPDDGGPYLLVNRRDPIRNKSVLRVARIEAV